MLTKYAVQLLVATTYVLASPLAPATNDVKNTVPALLRPEEDANTIAESLLGVPPLADPEVLEKRQNESRGNVNSTPSGKSELGAPGSKGQQTCPASGCAKCKPKKSSPVVPPANPGKLPEGYLKNVKKPQQGKLPTTTAQSPKDNVKNPITKPQKTSSLKKRYETRERCGIRFQLPSVPDSRYQALITQANGWWYSMQYDFKGTCSWKMEMRRTPGPAEFEVAFAYEPFLVEMFLNYLSGQRGVDCDTMISVFGTPSGRFGGVSAAQAMANQMSSPRLPHEMFMVERAPKYMRQSFLSGRAPPRTADIEVMRAQLADAGLSFHFSNKPEVTAAFAQVNERVRRALSAVGPIWVQAYDGWLPTHLVFSQDVANHWLDSTLQSFSVALRRDRTMPEAESVSMERWAELHRDDHNGLFSRSRMRFAPVRRA